MVEGPPDPRFRAETCYLSTPEYARTFRGRFLYIYTDKGTLELADGKLRFRGKREQLDIGLDSLVELRQGRFGRVAKPIGLDRIELTFRTEGQVRTVYLVPTESAGTPTWKTNKIVLHWLALLEERRHAV